MGGGSVIHRNVPDSPLRQLAGQDIGCILCISIDGAVSNHNRLFLRLIAAPGQILVHVPADIFTPYRAVKRAQGMDIQAGRLL